MFDLLGQLVEGLLHWLASDRARWFWAFIGLGILAIAWLVAQSSLAAAFAIGFVGALAIIYGVVGTIFGGPEERD